MITVVASATSLVEMCSTSYATPPLGQILPYLGVLLTQLAEGEPQLHHAALKMFHEVAPRRTPRVQRSDE